MTIKKGKSGRAPKKTRIAIKSGVSTQNMIAIGVIVGVIGIAFSFMNMAALIPSVGNNLASTSGYGYANPISWYKLEGNAKDETGSHNGTPVGGLAVIPGKVDNAYQFNGTNSYVNTGYNFPLTKDDKISFSLWIKPDATTTNDIICTGSNDKACASSMHTIISRRSVDGSPYVLYQNKDRLYFRIYANPYGLNTGLFLTLDNQWHHIAATYDGQKARLYLDGVLKSTSGVSNNLTFYPSNGSMTIGTGYSWRGMWGNFKGGIDEVMIYNRALNQAEIDGLALKVRGKLAFINSKYSASSSYKNIVGSSSIIGLFDLSASLDDIKINKIKFCGADGGLNPSITPKSSDFYEFAVYKVSNPYPTAPTFRGYFNPADGCNTVSFNDLIIPKNTTISLELLATTSPSILSGTDVKFGVKNITDIEAISLTSGLPAQVTSVAMSAPFIMAKAYPSVSGGYCNSGILNSSGSKTLCSFYIGNSYYNNILVNKISFSITINGDSSNVQFGGFSLINDSGQVLATTTISNGKVVFEKLNLNLSNNYPRFKLDAVVTGVNPTQNISIITQALKDQIILNPSPATYSSASGQGNFIWSDLSISPTNPENYPQWFNGYLIDIR